MTVSDALNSQEFFFTALANPFATEWVPISENLLPGNVRTYESAISVNRHWFFLTVFLRGAVYYDPDVEEVPTHSAVLSSGQIVSPFKVEIEYSTGNSYIRKCRFDIGSGTSVFIPATSVVKARVLVPDPESVPLFLPPEISTNRNVRVASSVVIASSCEDAPTGQTDCPLYTQLFYTDPANQPAAQAEVVCGAREVQLFSSEPFVGRASFVFDRPGSATTPIRIGAFVRNTVGPDVTRSDITLIPQAADLIRIEPTAGPTVLSLVQRICFP